MNENNVNKVTSGIYMGSSANTGNWSTKNVIEDFLTSEYEPGLRNEFNMMDALINRLPKDTITGKVKYKSFALGITDNVRAVGSGTYDRYELGFEDFYGKGTDSVEAQFDTTKLMATFSITDEAMLKGTGDGSLIDVLKDSLDRMEIGLKHTFNRYTYGGHDGIIGTIKEGGTITKKDLGDHAVSAKTDEQKLMDYRGAMFNKFYGNAPLMVEFSFANSHSLIEGMGVMVEIVISSPSPRKKRLVGRIFQKDNTHIHSEKIVMAVEKIYEDTGSGSFGAATLASNDTTFNTITTSSTVKATVYSRQLKDTSDIKSEYHGLQDIIIRSDATDANAVLFGIDRRIYTSLRCTTVDLQNKSYLNEELLRDLSDHLALTSPDGTNINLVCANHRIISEVEKSMYQFKNYNLDSVQNGVQLGGRGDIRFDNFVLVKDRYARDNNLYMLDQTKIGELVRRDFQWITSGEVNGVLQRRPGTEMYEGIMNKYADMYIDAWRCHAAIKNCKVPEVGAFISYASDGLPKSK